MTQAEIRHYQKSINHFFKITIKINVISYSFLQNSLKIYSLLFKIMMKM